MRSARLRRFAGTDIRERGGGLDGWMSCAIVRPSSAPVTMATTAEPRARLGARIAVTSNGANGIRVFGSLSSQPHDTSRRFTRYRWHHKNPIHFSDSDLVSNPNTRAFIHHACACMRACEHACALALPDAKVMRTISSSHAHRTRANWRTRLRPAEQMRNCRKHCATRLVPPRVSAPIRRRWGEKLNYD